MQSHEIYQRYLVATRMTQIADELGVTLSSIDMNVLDPWWHTAPEYADTYQGYAYDVLPRFELYHLEPEAREQFAIDVLDRLSGASLHRKNGRIGILAYVHGLRVEIAVGEGVCEKVQVGTRIVPAVPAQPEREEPVYEIRCPDPIVAAAIQ